MSGLTVRLARLRSLLDAQISIRNTQIVFSIWDLGGQREFVK